MPQTTKAMALSTTPQVVLAADASRTYVLFRNESSTAAEIIRVGPSNMTLIATPATAGYSIPPGGQLALPSIPQGGDNIAASAWWAASESGTPVLAILANDQLS
jgi:hypothetical protein